MFYKLDDYHWATNIFDYICLYHVVSQAYAPACQFNSKLHILHLNNFTALIIFSKIVLHMARISLEQVQYGCIIAIELKLCRTAKSFPWLGGVLTNEKSVPSH